MGSRGPAFANRTYLLALRAAEWQAGAGEERLAAPLLEGAGTARAAWLACSPRAFPRIPIYNQKMNTEPVILYPFLFRGVVNTFERIMVEDKKILPTFL